MDRLARQSVTRPVLKRVGLVAAAAGSALFLQGCVAAVVPLAAAGIMGKKEIDKARLRAKQAEASFDPASIPRVVTVGDQLAAAKPAAPVDAAPAQNLQNNAVTASPYFAFASFAVEQAEKQQAGESVRSVVLVEKVSLADPQTMACDAKPILAVIDLDAAPDALPMTETPDFGDTLHVMRTNGVGIAWIADADEMQLAAALTRLRAGKQPAMSDADLVLLGETKGARKQERRWRLARDHCVVAIAGDRRADFDELYDYLRDPSFAIRLESMFGNGWFELPPIEQKATP